jgi:hypothetical protein
MVLHNAQQGHDALSRMWAAVKPLLLAGKRITVTVKPDTRTLAQNRLMWSCLRDLSAQVEWCGKRLTDKGWKDYITGHLDGQELIPNMHGTGFISVNRGQSTSDMTIAEMTAVIDLAHAFGDERGVTWSRTSLGREWPDEMAA